MYVDDNDFRRGLGYTGSYLDPNYDPLKDPRNDMLLGPSTDSNKVKTRLLDDIRGKNLPEGTANPQVTKKVIDATRKMPGIGPLKPFKIADWGGRIICVGDTLTAAGKNSEFRKRVNYGPYPARQIYAEVLDMSNIAHPQVEGLILILFLIRETEMPRLVREQRLLICGIFFLVAGLAINLYYWNNEILNIFIYIFNIILGVLIIFIWRLRFWLCKLHRMVKISLGIGFIYICLCILFFMCIHWSGLHNTPEIKDASKYERLMGYSNYQKNAYLADFPRVIPNKAVDLRFYYMRRDSCNGPVRIQLRFKAAKENIEALDKTYSVKPIWSGHDGEEGKAGLRLTRFRNKENTGYERLPNDFGVYVTRYKEHDPYFRICSGTAISKPKNEIIYWAEMRPYDPWLHMEY